MLKYSRVFLPTLIASIAMTTVSVSLVVSAPARADLKIATTGAPDDKNAASTSQPAIKPGTDAAGKLGGEAESKTPDERCEAVLKQVLELYYQGSYEAAESKVGDALQINPNSARALNVKGVLMHLRQDNAGAERMYRQAMAADPKYVKPLINLADLYTEKKKPGDAEKLYLKAIELEPQNSGWLCSLAGFYRARKKNPADIERLYRQAAELEPKNVAIRGQLADYYASNKKTIAEAEAQYRQCLEIAPTNITLMQHMAVFAFDVQKDPVEAERLFRKVIEVEPKEANHVVNLGILFEHIKKSPEEIEAVYQQALKINPDSFMAVSRLASLYFNVNKDVATAYPLFRKAVEIEPKDGLSRANLALCLLAQGHKDEAMAEAKQGLALGYNQAHPAYEQLGLRKSQPTFLQILANALTKNQEQGTAAQGTPSSSGGGHGYSPSYSSMSDAMMQIHQMNMSRINNIGGNGWSYKP